MLTRRSLLTVILGTSVAVSAIAGGLYAAMPTRAATTTGHTTARPRGATARHSTLALTHVPRTARDARAEQALSGPAQAELAAILSVLSPYDQQQLLLVLQQLPPELVEAGLENVMGLPLTIAAPQFEDYAAIALAAVGAAQGTMTHQEACTAFQAVLGVAATSQPPEVLPSVEATVAAAAQFLGGC
jgi:hypothetical protein